MINDSDPLILGGNLPLQNHETYIKLLEKVFETVAKERFAMISHIHIIHVISTYLLLGGNFVRTSVADAQDYHSDHQMRRSGKYPYVPVL